MSGTDHPGASPARPQLSDAKRALLEARLKGTAKAAPRRAAITRREGGPVHPMSFGQERLWFMDQLVPDSPFYNLPAAILVSASIDVAVLERAVGEVVRRHAALRTVYRMDDGKPVQVVMEPYDVRVEVEDIRGPNGEAASQEEVRRAVAAEAARPFDLKNGPPFRLKLVRVSDEDYAQVLTVHHIATDGWSMPIVSGEIEYLYGAFSRGEPSPLPEPPIQYTDYSAWQREYLQGDVMRKQVDHWKGHLGGAPALELPTDRPRPAMQSFSGGAYRFEWSRGFTDELRALAMAESASMNMLVMSGLYALLRHYTGQEDVVVGTLLGNRNRAEIEPLVGFFVNTAAIRVRMEDDPSFRTLLQRVRAGVLDADANQEVPFDVVVEALGSERDLSRNALFQVMYFHHALTAPVHQAEGEEAVSPMGSRPLSGGRGISAVDTRTTKFDLTVMTLEDAQGMPNLVEYNTDLFDESTIARMMEHLGHVLADAVARPDAPVSTLVPLGREERRLLVEEWSSPRAEYDTSVPVHRLFARAAARAPGAPAVAAGGETVSYGELDARANRVAHRLRALGVGREERVAVCMERSADFLAALLGVLKAGAAYVPIDPAYPRERIAFVLRDSGARVLLTQERLRDGLPEFGGTTVTDADPELAAAPGGEVDGGADAGSLAYVIYTSGSTGTPKGVQVEHGALANLVHWHREAFAVTAADRATQVAATGFDASGWEVWPYLACGASVHVVDDALRAAPAELAAWMVERGITVSFLPTPLAEAVLAADWPAEAPLRLLLTGGDRLRAHPRPGLPFALVNNYGPTECTVVATSGVVEAKDGDAAGFPGIGRPIANVRAYVLDPRLNPVPIGVPGELFLGGDQLARGYLGRPELDAERFVADPFSARPGARLYRTGDRVRWRADGTLDFLDRVDDQVKVRGHRIELGEIETALRRHPAVSDAVAAVREDAPGDRRLAAYLVLRPGAEMPAPGEMRTFLKQALPDYMVPAAYVALDALPVTANGKVDRRALPAPEPAAGDGEEAMPTGEVQSILVEIWKEVLRAERVGIHDNFFDLGGDSILSIHVISRAAQEGLRITPRQMFQFQTVAELAAVVGQSPRVEAEQGPVAGPAPLTPVQRWYFGLELAETHHFNLAFALEARVRLDADALRGALAAVMDHHDALRMRYRRAAGGWEQTGTEPGGEPPFETVDLSGVPDEDLPAALEAAGTRAQGSLDIQDGPLVRLLLADAGEGRPQRVLFVAHHLVVDAVSWAFVSADLEAAYRALAAGEAAALPRKTTSFRQWAEKLTEHAASPAVRAELPYWTDPGRGAVAPLPRDGDGEDLEGHARRVGVALDEEATRALLTEVPPVYGTQINDVLLTALAMAFQRWTGSPDLLVDLEGHGREDLFETVDISRTAGWFTTIHPVLLRLPAGGGRGEAIKSVKEQLREIPGKGIGYGLLRWSGGDPAVEAALAALPAPDVAFNYLGQIGGAAASDEAASAAPPADAGKAPDGPVLAMAGWDSGPARSPRGRRTHLLAIDAMVVGGRLAATFTHGPARLAPETADRLAQGWMEALEELIEHCRTPEAGGVTPSDFALAGLDQASLDAVMEQLGGSI